MRTTTISLILSEDLFYEIKSLPGQNMSMNEKLQMSHAIGMFVSQEISLAKAAEMAKKTLFEFVDILKTFGIPAAVYTTDMLQDELEFLQG